MKALNLVSLSAMGVSAFLAFGLSSNSLANNQGFPLVDKRPEQAEQQPTRYFVKYIEGKEGEVRALLQQHDIQVVEVLVERSVLIVTGEQSELDKLANHESVEYTEPEPVRRLLSQ